jgi:two-component system NtrC family sensor kinase
MLRQMEEGVVLVDKDGRVILANDAAVRMLGLAERDPIGASVIELLSRPDFAVVRAAMDRMRHEEERNVTQEYAVRGRTYLCSITAVRADETVQGEGEVILIKDISEFKEIENQLLQSSKMSAVGQLAAGVAHEFNNLMASVYGYAQFMKQHPENAAVVQKGVEVILRSSERARELTTSLLTFSRRRPGRREPVDVNQILTDTLLLLHRQMEKSGVRVERTSDRIPLTVADPGKLQEVLLNMLVNAQQAMPDGGHLRVTSRVEGAGIEIRIEDEGMGIPPENLSRIFEPFFTTKGPLSGAKQPGTGLGLSTAYNHIRDHGGSIRATSTPGKGSCFVIQLPIRTMHEKREETAGPPAPRSLDVSGRVLIAEDDPTLCGLISEILAGLGHEVLVCAEANQILARIEEAPPDLLILNPTLASSEDADFLGTLRAAAPRLPLLIVTTREAGDAVESGGDPWLFRLNKPFRNRDLVTLVSRILSQSLRRAG